MNSIIKGGGCNRNNIQEIDLIKTNISHLVDVLRINEPLSCSLPIKLNNIT